MSLSTRLCACPAEAAAIIGGGGPGPHTGLGLGVQRLPSIEIIKKAFSCIFFWHFWDLIFNLLSHQSTWNLFLLTI